MKKVLSLIMAMTFLFVSYAQKTDSLPIPDTAKLTLGKVYSDVKAGINGLAQSLKVPATHVYGVMVKQQTVSAITWLIVDIFLFLVALFFAIVWGIDKSEDKNEWWGVPVVFFCIFLIFIFFNLSDIIGGLINPEYGAIKEIISFVK